MPSPPNAWKGALYRWSHTSNIKSHMMAAHGDLDVDQSEVVKKLKTATAHFEESSVCA